MSSPCPRWLPLASGLAVTQSWQSQELGKALLRDAILRTLPVAEMVGVKALMVQARSDTAAHFYWENGFYASPVQRRTLFLPLAEAQHSLP